MKLFGSYFSALLSALCISALSFSFPLFSWRQRQHREPARRRLAPRTKIAASPRHDRAPDACFAAIAAFSLSSVRPMVPLILSRLAFRVKKIGNRGSAQHNRFLQNIL